MSTTTPMSDTPKTDELDEVSTVMSDEETVKAYKKLARLLEREVNQLRADKERLDWLCDLITNKGLNAMHAIAWTVYDEDGKSLMHRETVSEDEVEEIRFDRAAIDAAKKGTP